ncbi:IMPACT family protein [Marinobacterium weihaiense]|uniref:IMPACT family protein n=1 Tax=Marinobacterium weihaiense TaxID=2851016 RepID=A0ABS6MC58_9GAMM|nr:YigZ family protein [Marinobacterium weihaiense]MBV0933469.1 IMPACT family protein [Marinobacterium weihaiense]
MAHYKTLAAPLHSELEIKKSRFLGCIEPIHSHQAGLERVAELWRQHPDARHVCYVMLVDGQVRQSDDGEPSGTAAKPMLNVLQHKGLDHVLATVVRYFGGIKLGAGGLVRAYSQAVSEPLQQAEFMEVRPQSVARVQFDYAHEALVRHLAEQAGLQLEVEYAQQVQACLSGEAQPLEACLQQLTTQTRGELMRLPD